MADPCSTTISRTEFSNHELSYRSRPESLLGTSCSERSNGTRSKEEIEKKQNGLDRIPLRPDPELCRTRLQYLVESQENVARLRLLVQERRAALRVKRLEVSQSDTLFMDELYRWRSKSNGRIENFGRLQELYNQCQTARMEVGPADDDYEELELQLGEVEHANGKQIHRLISSLQNDASIMALEDLEDSSVDSHISFDSSTSGEDHEDEQVERSNEPANVESSLISDHLLSLDIEKNAEASTTPGFLLRRTRNQASAISSGDRIVRQTPRTFSDDRVSTENGLWRNWNPVPSEHDVARTFERDLLDVPDDTSEAGRPYNKDFVLRNFDLKFNRSLSELLFFGEVQKMPLQFTPCDSQSTLQDYLFKFRSTRNRVNRWLLHCLRTSHTAAMNFQQTVSETGGLNDEWATCALNLWEKDEAAISQPESVLTDPTTVYDPVNAQSNRSEQCGRAPSPEQADVADEPDKLLSQVASRSTDYTLFRWIGSELL